MSVLLSPFRGSDRSPVDQAKYHRKIQHHQSWGSQDALRSMPMAICVELLRPALGGIAADQLNE
jgi:hypothetical protein